METGNVLNSTNLENDEKDFSLLFIAAEQCDVDLFRA